MPAELTKEDRDMIEELAVLFYPSRDTGFTKAIEIAFLAGKSSGIGLAMEIVRDERVGRAA